MVRTRLFSFAFIAPFLFFSFSISSGIFSPSVAVLLVESRIEIKVSAQDLPREPSNANIFSKGYVYHVPAGVEERVPVQKVHQSIAKTATITFCRFGFWQDWEPSRPTNNNNNHHIETRPVKTRRHKA
jgi:hypothetical protein